MLESDLLVHWIYTYLCDGNYRYSVTDVGRWDNWLDFDTPKCIIYYRKWQKKQTPHKDLEQNVDWADEFVIFFYFLYKLYLITFILNMNILKLFYESAKT